MVQLKSLGTIEVACIGILMAEPAEAVDQCGTVLYFEIDKSGQVSRPSTAFLRGFGSLNEALELNFRKKLHLCIKRAMVRRS